MQVQLCGLAPWHDNKTNTGTSSPQRLHVEAQETVTTGGQIVLVVILLVLVAVHVYATVRFCRISAT